MLSLELQCYDALARVKSWIDVECTAAKSEITKDFADLRVMQEARWNQIELDLLGTKEERAAKTIEYLLNETAHT